MRKIAFATGGILALTGGVRVATTVASSGPAGLWFMAAPVLHNAVKVGFCVSVASLAIDAINSKVA